MCDWPRIFPMHNTSRLCFAGPLQESEQAPHGPVNHCPLHCLSLEQALEVSGLPVGSQSLRKQTLSRVWVPVPHASEHCDHSVSNQFDVFDTVVVADFKHGWDSQYSACFGRFSCEH